MWDRIKHMTKEQEEQDTHDPADNPGLAELERYLGEHVSQDVDSVYNWWKERKQKYPLLFKLAMRFLFCPPSSVASESLFSSTGQVDSDCRKRLETEKIEVLVFIKRNHDLI